MFVAKKLANFHVNINLPHKQNEDDAITVIDKILEVSLKFFKNLLDLAVFGFLIRLFHENKNSRRIFV